MSMTRENEIITQMESEKELAEIESSSTNISQELVRQTNKKEIKKINLKISKLKALVESLDIPPLTSATSPEQINNFINHIETLQNSLLQNSHTHEVRQNRLTPNASERFKENASYLFYFINKINQGVFVFGAYPEALEAGAIPTYACFGLGALLFGTMSIIHINQRSQGSDKAILELNQSIIKALNKLTVPENKLHRDNTRSELSIGERLCQQIEKQIELLMHYKGVDKEIKTDALLKELYKQVIFLTMVIFYANALPENKRQQVYHQQFDKRLNLLGDLRVQIVGYILNIQHYHPLAAFETYEHYNAFFTEFCKDYSIDFPEKGVFGVPGDIRNKLTSLPYHLFSTFSQTLNHFLGLATRGAESVANAFIGTNTITHRMEHLTEYFEASERTESSNLDLESQNTSIESETTQAKNEAEQCQQRWAGAKQEYVNNVVILQKTLLGYFTASLNWNIASLGLFYGNDKRKEKREELQKFISTILKDIKTFNKNTDDIVHPTEVHRHAVGEKVTRTTAGLEKIMIALEKNLKKLQNYNEELKKRNDDLSYTLESQQDEITQKDQEIEKMHKKLKRLQKKISTLEQKLAMDKNKNSYTSNLFFPVSINNPNSKPQNNQHAPLFHPMLELPMGTFEQKDEEPLSRSDGFVSAASSNKSQNLNQFFHSLDLPSPTIDQAKKYK